MGPYSCGDDNAISHIVELILFSLNIVGFMKYIQNVNHKHLVVPEQYTLIGDLLFDILLY